MTTCVPRLVTPMITAIAFFMLTGCGPNQHYWQTVKDDFRQMPSHLIQDSNDLIHNRQHVSILVVAGAASGYTRLEHDDAIDDHYKKTDTFPRDMSIAIGTAGSPATHFALAGSGYLLGLFTENSQTRQVSYSLTEALAYTGFYTMTLKLIAQDESPNGEELAWPSGHTSSTVAFAAVLDSYYGPLVGVPLYALSGLVAYERIDNREHWASDCIFGAAIGYTIGKTVADRYRPQLFGCDVVPYFSPLSESTGIALAKTF